MAVTNVTPIISYTKDGSAGTVHPIPFKLLRDADLELYVDGVLSTDGFTVTGAGTDSVTVVTTLDYTDGTKVTFKRNVDYKQETTFSEGEAYPGDRIENEFDNLAMQIQQVNELTGRMPVVAPGNTPPGGNLVQATSTTLGQDANGNWKNRTVDEEVEHLGIGAKVTEATTAATTATTKAAEASTDATTATTKAAEAAASAASISDSASATNVFTFNEVDDVGAVNVAINGFNIGFDQDTDDQDPGSAAVQLAQLINDAQAGTLVTAEVQNTRQVKITAIASGSAGNGITCTETSTEGSWANATTQNGVDGVVLRAVDQTFTEAQQKATRNNIGFSEKAVYIASTTADPTGATDASQIIQDAIDGPGSNPSRIIFPEGGNYLCKNLTIPANTTVELTGCTLTYGGTSPAGYAGQNGMFWMEGTDASTMAENFHIIGGKVVGDGYVVATMGDADAIQVAYCRNVIIEGVTVYDWGQDGIELKTCENAVVRNCVIDTTWDAAIEFRGGRNCHAIGNTAINTKNGFMTKPNVLVANTSEENGTEYYVANNDFTVRSIGILANWANDSVYENNRIYPQSGSTSVIGISTEAHADANADRIDLTIRNIDIRNNRFYGTTDNTFIRQVLPSGMTTIENCNYEGNKLFGQCHVGFDLEGIVTVKDNFVEAVDSDAGSYSLKMQAEGDCQFFGNHFPTDTCEFISGDYIMTFSQNTVNAITLTAGTLVGNENTFLSLTAPSSATGVQLRGSSYRGASTSVDFITNYCDEAVFDGVDVETTGALNGGINNYGADVRISNFRFKGGGTTGTAIELQSGADRCVVSGGVIDAGSTGSTQVLVRSDDCDILNVRVSGGSQGIRLLGDDNNVIGCRARDSQYQQIHVLTGATDNHLQHCQVSGSGTGWQDQGTGTINENNRF